jgi:N-acetylglutamate synthase/N-acetylornithine aminotransferase
VVSRAVDCSFNAITVDGDTSTNDPILAYAAGEPLVPEHFEALEAGLMAVSQHLLQSVRSIGAQQHRLHDGNRKPVATMVRGWSFFDGSRMGHDCVTADVISMALYYASWLNYLVCELPKMVNREILGNQSCDSMFRP